MSENKPTIEELEVLLNSGGEVPWEILPSGEIKARPTVADLPTPDSDEYANLSERDRVWSSFTACAKERDALRAEVGELRAEVKRLRPKCKTCGGTKIRLCGHPGCNGEHPCRDCA